MQCTSITSFDECYTPNNWVFPNITRPFSIIYYVLGGSAFYTLDGVEKAFKKDHLYILPANRVFSLRELPNDKFYSLYVHAYTFPEINDVIEIDVSSDCFVADTLKMIRAYAKMGDKNEIRMHKLTDMLISYISQTDTNNNEPLRSRIKEHVEENFVKVFHNSDLSGDFNYSNSYLVKLFKSEYNITPKQYAEQMVLKEIAVLLHKGLPISEISRRLLFSSPENLCRFFKSAYGCAPTEYIKRFKNFPL